MIATVRTHCRLCKSAALVEVLRLPDTPPANEYTSTVEEALAQEKFPLRLLLCRECGHVQLGDSIPADRLFRNYRYVSGVGPTMVAHFRQAASRVATELLKPGDLVVDIGSNDGVGLRPYKEMGMRVLGVDPAREIAAAAAQSGIPTVPEFFEGRLATGLKAAHGPAKLITASNVFVHTPEPDAIMAGVKNLLSEDGWFVVEVHYLGALVDKMLCDTIYGEHDAYGSVGPFARYFDRHGLRLVHVEDIPTHGGSIRCVVNRKQNDMPPGVIARIEAERAAKLHEPLTYAKLGLRWRTAGEELKQLLESYKWAASNGNSDSSIYVYGCPAKLTTLMASFGLDATLITAVIDDSPWKQGRYTPGLGIPIAAPALLQKKPPCALMVGAWNVAEPIIEKARSLGFKGPIIVPLPELQVR